MVLESLKYRPPGTFCLHGCFRAECPEVADFAIFAPLLSGILIIQNVALDFQVLGRGEKRDLLTICSD